MNKEERISLLEAQVADLYNKNTARAGQCSRGGKDIMDRVNERFSGVDNRFTATNKAVSNSSQEIFKTINELYNRIWALESELGLSYVYNKHGAYVKKSAKKVKK